MNIPNYCTAGIEYYINTKLESCNLERTLLGYEGCYNEETHVELVPTVCVQETTLEYGLVLSVNSEVKELILLMEDLPLGTLDRHKFLRDYGLEEDVQVRILKVEGDKVTGELSLIKANKDKEQTSTVGTSSSTDTSSSTPCVKTTKPAVEGKPSSTSTPAPCGKTTLIPSSSCKKHTVEGEAPCGKKPTVEGKEPSSCAHSATKACAPHGTTQGVTTCNCKGHSTKPTSSCGFNSEISCSDKHDPVQGKFCLNFKPSSAEKCNNFHKLAPLREGMDNRSKCNPQEKVCNCSKCNPTKSANNLSVLTQMVANPALSESLLGLCYVMQDIAGEFNIPCTVNMKSEPRPDACSSKNNAPDSKTKPTRPEKDPDACSCCNEQYLDACYSCDNFDGKYDDEDYDYDPCSKCEPRDHSVPCPRLQYCKPNEYKAQRKAQKAKKTQPTEDAICTKGKPCPRLEYCKPGIYESITGKKANVVHKALEIGRQGNVPPCRKPSPQPKQPAPMEFTFQQIVELTNLHPEYKNNLTISEFLAAQGYRF